MNVNVMTVDSAYEIQKIHKYHPGASLILRFRCDAKASLIAFGAKYGCDSDTEAKGLIELSKSLGLNMIGVSFHVGTGCSDSHAYAKGIQEARKVFELAKNIGYNFTVLDIGGGFPGDTNTNIKEIASQVNRSIDLYFPSPDIQVIAEPGRYFVASAFTLACQVHSKRDVLKNGTIDSIMYYINDGVYGQFNCKITEFKDVHPITLKSTDEEMFNSFIWGPTCDSLDLVCENVLLPKLDIGDLVIFENMGAYTMALFTSFNGFPEPIYEYYIQAKHLNIVENGIKTGKWKNEKIFFGKNETEFNQKCYSE